MREKRPEHEKQLRRYKGLQGWGVFKHVDNDGVVNYDIYREGYNEDRTLAWVKSDRFLAGKYYHRIGVVDSFGLVRSIDTYLDGPKYFNHSLRQAVRYLYLKTQKPTQ